MSKHLILMGNNVIAFNKNNSDYAMVCAWASFVDYDTISMLVGEQSQTGKMLCVGDVVGFSALAKGQKEISLFIGGNHSNEINKFKDIPVTRKNSAILLQNAKSQAICKVTKIMHFDDSKDNFVLLKILESKVDENAEFLTLDEVLPD